MITKRNDDEPAKQPWASFAGIEHPAFPTWMLQGLDKLFSGEPRITKIHFDLWVRSYHDDNNNHELNGTASFHTSGKVAEEDLDQVPAVRMFERRTSDLWNYVPVVVEEFEEANIDGEYDFYAERGLIFFQSRPMSDIEHYMTIEARHDGERWICKDYITLTSHDGPASDLLASDASAVLSVYDGSDLDLEKMPEAQSVAVEEDGNVIVYLKTGDLTRCMAKR